ncbi:hypothetical protein [Bacillus sp. FSL K6-1000]|uniref:hypothetical protein n=1 Tax=Bacillus sp. FSL K6-1000 TaxID=2921458 RepID=UPI00315A5746
MKILKKAVLSTIACELISLVDSGVNIEVNKVEELSFNHELFPELKKMVINKTLNKISEEQTNYLEEIIHNWTTAYSGRAWGKFEIKNNGLNLVIQFLINELSDVDKKEEI